MKRSIDTKDVQASEIIKNLFKFNKLLINKISTTKYKIKNLSNKMDFMMFSCPTIEKLINDEKIIEIKKSDKDKFILFIWKVNFFLFINIIPTIKKIKIFKLIIKLPAINEIGIKDKKKLMSFSKSNNFFNLNIFY